MSSKQHEAFYKDMKYELEELKRYTSFYNSYTKKRNGKKNKDLNDEIITQKNRFVKSFNQFIKHIEE